MKGGSSQREMAGACSEGSLPHKQCLPAHLSSPSVWFQGYPHLISSLLRTSIGFESSVFDPFLFSFALTLAKLMTKIIWKMNFLTSIFFKGKRYKYLKHPETAW